MLSNFTIFVLGSKLHIIITTNMTILIVTIMIISVFGGGEILGGSIVGCGDDGGEF